MVDIRTERGKLYGDPQEMHANIARIWTAQMRARFGSQMMFELDANIVELMMAGYKIARASRPVPTDGNTLKQWLDSPVDAKIFLDFAVESVMTPQPRDPKTLKFPERGSAADLDPHDFKFRPAPPEADQSGGHDD